MFFIFLFFQFFIFLHFLSFSFMFFHLLSCSFICFHLLSCSFIFFHFPSFSFFSFIFFHFLSFSFILLGAQNLIFLGLNFVTISLDSSNVKNHFLGPSRGFLNVFHFFIFSEAKVSSFLFSCISFKYVLLLTSISEFNCFLRSRCSMEMWCADDIGRDSWDWVGPPAWGRACFNSPEWGGGSSPVKTEPPQIVLL